jgi:restriction system protein
MRFFLDQSIYRRIDNLIVPDQNGATTQIDHTLVSPFGIFVIETKNKSGWIFGSETQANWTQVFPKRKFQFQNPLRQNYRHTKCLAGFLRLDSRVFHSIAFFVGDCQFKTAMPANVLRSGLCDYVKGFTKRLLQDSQVVEITQELEKLKADPRLNDRKHIASLKERHESDTICPSCGSELEEKVAQKGPNPGKSFIGCSTFPRCHFKRTSEPFAIG